MGINLVGAGAGASQVGHHQQHDLEDLLTQAFRQKQVEQEMELRRQAEERLKAGQQADETYRTGQVERQGRLDDAAATTQRAQSGQREVRSMIGDFLTQRGGAPLDAGSRQTLRAMAYREGLDAPDEANEPLAPKPAEGFTLSPGSKRFGADGKELASVAPTPHAPTQGREPNYLTLVGPNGEQRRVTDGREANTLLGQGWKQFDQVGARGANAGGGNPDEALDTAQEVQRIAKALRDAPGRSGAFGVLQSKLPTMRQGTADAEVLLNSLRSLLTLENTGKLKGVLSNADMELLRQASSTLAAQMSDPAAVAELNRLGQVMSRVTQQPWDAPAPTGGGGEAEYDYVNGKLVRRGSAAR